MFRVDADRYDFVEILQREFGARVLGWCLMPTHVPVVVAGEDVAEEESGDEAFGEAGEQNGYDDDDPGTEDR